MHPARNLQLLSKKRYQRRQKKDLVVVQDQHQEEQQTTKKKGLPKKIIGRSGKKIIGKNTRFGKPKKYTLAVGNQLPGIEAKEDRKKEPK